FGQISEVVSQWRLKSYLNRLFYNFIDCLVDLMRQVTKLQVENPRSKILSGVFQCLVLLLEVSIFHFKCCDTRG
ncbi:hypothetical protein Tco_0310629, partial [Tanacetum coccineum]